MSEKASKKEAADAELAMIAGGTAGSERVIYNFKCSCGNVVMRGNEEFPKFPCPKCMKKEWEYAGTSALTPPRAVLEKKE